MNRMKIACTIVLCLFLGAIAFAQQEEAQPREAPQQQQPEARPETPEKQEPENAKPDQQKQKQTEEEKKAEKEAKSNSQQSKEGNATPEQQGQGGKRQAAGKGGHIPDDKFRVPFGKSHTFVINKPVVVNNQPTFVNGGYTFVIVNPWPVGWAYTDSCYIDYVDGEYFLFDLLHPGISIALIVQI